MGQAITEQECAPIELDQGAGPLVHVPVFNQLGPHCYAYAGAQMVEAWRRSHPPLPPPPFLTSPLPAISSIHKPECINSDSNVRDSKACSGGFIVDALDYFRSSPACDHDKAFAQHDDLNLMNELSKIIKKNEKWRSSNKKAIQKALERLLRETWPEYASGSTHPAPTRKGRGRPKKEA